MKTHQQQQTSKRKKLKKKKLERKMILKRFLSNLKDNKKVISINKSNLLKYENSWPTNDEILKIEEKKEQLVPLVNHLRSIIKTRGPLSVHDYMAQVNNNFFYISFLSFLSLLSFYYYK